MPKCNRIVIPDLPHHICHRGNLGQDVFFLDSDRTLYLGLLNEHSQVHRVTIQAYCLMSNHVHVIATPQDSSGLHRTFQRVQGDYARALHTRLNRRGNLWHGRFRSAAMDEDYFWAAMVYVEQNPVRAGIVTAAEAWTWSSARAHAEEHPDPMLELDPLANQIYGRAMEGVPEARSEGLLVPRTNPAVDPERSSSRV